MGKRLHAESEVFAHGIDECARALKPWVGWSLTDVVTGAEQAASLDRVDVVQPVLFALMVSLARVWRSFGVTPDAVVGHSQGEIAAACVSGALSLPDAARVVALRSRALTELVGLGGGMSAVAASPGWVHDRLRRWPSRLSVAAVNGPSSVVLSGDDAALEEFAAMAADDAVRVRRVKVDYASHSSQVERIRARVLAAAENLSPREPAVEFYSTVTGGPLGTRVLDGSYWYENLRSTVRFGEVAEHLMRTQGSVFVEVSPHPVLEVAMLETADTIAAAPVVVGTLHKDDGSASEILASLAELHVRGVPVDWTPAFAAGRPSRVDLPTYPFQRQRYWLAAADPDGQPGGDGPRAGGAELDSELSARDLVCAEAATVLGTKGIGLTSADLAARSAQTFKDLGFDSSMAVRLRNRLTAAAGVRLPATVAFSYPTPQALGRHIFSLLERAAPEVSETTAREASVDNRSDDELYELVDRGYA
jgi:acyl transferase domain-containing protein